MDHSRLYQCPIVQRAMRGMAPRDIARELNAVPRSVHDRLKYVRSRGVNVRNFASVPDDTRRMIVQLSLEGLTGRSIARRAGVNPGTVVQVLRRARQSGDVVPPPRPVRLDVPPQIAAAMAPAAASRGMNVAELAQALLHVLASEPALLANVLDDGVPA